MPTSAIIVAMIIAKFLIKHKQIIMKNTVTLMILITVLITGIFYALGFFIYANYDIAVWDRETKGIMGSIWLIFILGANIGLLANYFDIKSEVEKASK